MRPSFFKSRSVILALALAPVYALAADTLPNQALRPSQSLEGRELRPMNLSDLGLRSPREPESRPEKNDRNKFAPGQAPRAVGGGIHGGGGGKREPLFKDIAVNIANWIQIGNADAIAPLLHRYNFTLNEYKTEMLKVLSSYHVTFTDEKVEVNGKEKTCRGYIDELEKYQIICNNTQFGDDTADNINLIYRNVHHEFAGLACVHREEQDFCLEQNINEESDYRFSKFVSGQLEPAIVMRLPEIMKATSQKNNLVTCKVRGEFYGSNGDYQRLNEYSYVSSAPQAGYGAWRFEPRGLLSIEGHLQATNVRGISVFFVQAILSGPTVRSVGEGSIVLSPSAPAHMDMPLTYYGQSVGNLEFSCKVN